MALASQGLGGCKCSCKTPGNIWNRPPGHSLTFCRPVPKPSHICSARKIEQQLYVAVDPHPPLKPAPTTPCWIPPVIFFGIATLFSIMILNKREKKAAVQEQDETLLMCNPQNDPRGYQRALARTRQAAYITKAIAFMKAGEPARAYMELSRALNENSICRTGLQGGHHTEEELAELYKLHIKNSEVPPHFATLLQLQEMLSINQDYAEKIELEVLQAPGAFSI